ncbi:Glycerophosphoryl diester phosphodiesterase membrane domain-containing protein [Paraburkholderia sacchari]|uniref:hypothetical protein n=1 Tax=Paraburkholderia sacchari TaxID=159450 RepID=UPI0039A42DE6
MQQMTFMECVKHAWGSAREAFTSMPALVLGTFVAYAVLGGLALAGRPLPGEGEGPSAGLVLLANLASLFNALVYVWFTLKVYRFVLLGEPATPLIASSAKPLLRIVALGLVMMLALVGIAAAFWLVLRPRHEGGVAFLSLIVGAIWIFIGVRLSLLYPSLAIGGRFAPGAAWRDSRGHFWSVLGVSCVAALPLLACGVLALIGLGAAGVTPEDVKTPAWITVLAIGQSVVNVTFALLTSTALAWLYRRYANELESGGGPNDVRGR